VWSGVVAALAVGVIVGGAARVLMRLVTLSAGHSGKFSWSGSISIALIYAVAMVPAGVAAAMTVRWYRWLFAAAGSVFLCFPAVGVASEELGDTSGLSMFQWVAVVVTSIGVFATIAVAALMTVRMVDLLHWRDASVSPPAVQPDAGSAAAPSAAT
jgi:hypothetical protein